VKDPVYTVLVDSAGLDCSISFLFEDLVVKRAISHGLGGGADASGDIVIVGLRCSTDVVYHRCFGQDTKVFGDRGGCSVYGCARRGCWEECSNLLIHRVCIIVGLGGGGCEIVAYS
jgi:hypothetical protein